MALSAISGVAWGQDAVGTGSPAGTASGGRGARLSFLSADDRAHLLRVRQQVLAENPDLKTEQENLVTQWKSARGQDGDASADDKQAMREKMRDFREKLNAAMVKDDPSVQPILDQVKAHLKERFRQKAAGTAGAGDDSSQ